MDKYSNAQLLQWLNDPDKMRDIALRLQSNPESPALSLFRHAFQQLRAAESPRVLNNIHIIQHISGFVPWKKQWTVVRNVSKSWKYSVETSRFDETIRSCELHPEAPKKLFKMVKNILIEFPHDFEESGLQAKILDSCRNLQSVYLHSIPELDVDFADNLLGFSTNSLKTLWCTYPYELKHNFRKLETFSSSFASGEDSLAAMIRSSRQQEIPELHIHVYSATSNLSINEEVYPIIEPECNLCFVHAEDLPEIMDHMKVDSLQTSDLDALEDLELHYASSLLFLNYQGEDSLEDWKEILSKFPNLQAFAHGLKAVSKITGLRNGIQLISSEAYREHILKFARITNKTSIRFLPSR